MPDLTIEFAPWPVGTSVGVYRRKSELMMPDQPPPQVDQAGTAVVADDSSVTFPDVPEGEWWAVGQIDGVYRYVALVAEALEDRITALEGRVTAVEGDVDQLQTDVGTLDSRIDQHDADVVAGAAGRAALATAILNVQPGVIAPSDRGWGTQAVTLIANRAFVSRFVTPRAMTITQIAFIVETAAGADNPVDVGLYSAAGARLASSGAVLGKLNVIGRKTVPVAATLLAANTVYYVALSSPSTNNLLGVGGAGQGGGVHGLFGPNIGQADVMVQSGAYPLPANIAPGVTAATIGVLMAALE